MNTRYFILKPYPNYHNKPRVFTELTEEQYFAAGGTRQCRSCKQELTPSEFYDLSSSPDGLHPNCKLCCKVSRALESIRARDKRSKVSVRQRVRAMNLGVLVDRDITLVSIYRKHRGLCYICREWVQPRHASIEHILALSNGGTHSHANVALAHLTCNLQKGTTIIHRIS